MDQQAKRINTYLFMSNAASVYTLRNYMLKKFKQLLNNLSHGKILKNEASNLDLEPCIKLRGGGCCGTKKIHSDITYGNQNFEENFASKLQTYTNIIVEKSLNFQDKMNQEEILAAFQWFHNHKEQFNIICKDDALNSQFYELIERIVEQLMKQLIIFLKLSGFLFYLLLQICNVLFRIIFSYQSKNEERYMQAELHKRFLEYIQEIESQIQVESINIWFNGVDFELKMIKTCIAHCRTNSEKGKELAISIMSGLISSLSQLKPSDELIDSLIEGGKFLLLNFYNKQIQNPLQIYEIYYFFEILKWSIVNQLKQGYSVQNIIRQIQDGYQKYIKLSKDWMIHYCWVNLISDLMCYRPIVQKDQLSQLMQIGTANQENWNQLLKQNQIILLPYNKFAGKLKIFGNQNFKVKKFAPLKLFQEYLIQNSSEIQLLQDYINFNFNCQADQQLNEEDLFIQQLTSQSNLELIKDLNNYLGSQKDQLINNFESVKQQVLQYNAQLKNNKVIEIKIIKQDIHFLMKSFKQTSNLILCLLQEINLLVNKELQINSIFQTFLESLNTINAEQLNKIKQQTLTLIQEIENKHIAEFIGNLDQVTAFWIHLSEYTTIQHEELIEGNLEQDQSLEIQLNETIQVFATYCLNIDKFLLQVSTVKRNFLNILKQQNYKDFLKAPISQRHIAEEIIRILYSKLIVKLVNKVQGYFQNMEKVKSKIEEVQDIRKVLKIIYTSLNIHKGIKMMLCVHQKKLNTIFPQFQGIFSSKGVQEADGEQQNQTDINEQIRALILDKKEKLQILFNKYQNTEFTKEQQNDFNNLSYQIYREINDIKKQNWKEQIQEPLILLFQEVRIKLEIFGLVQKERNIIQQEILKLLDSYLQEINQEEKTEELQSCSRDPQLPSSRQELLKLNLGDLIECEKFIKTLEGLIMKSQKLKRIFKSNLIEAATYNQSTNVQLLNKLKSVYTQSLYQIISDISQQTLQFCQQINRNEQMIFSENFIAKLQKQPQIQQVHVRIQILNFNTLCIEDQAPQNQDRKDDIISTMFKELKKSTKTNQEVSIFDMFQNSSYKAREILVFNLIKMQSVVQEEIIQEFCENLLKQIWIIEKHPSVRSLLKNEEMIVMQKKLFSKDLQNFSNKLKTEMQNRFKQIEQLETQILLSDNQEEIKLQLQQEYENFEIYLDNITDMSQRLDISLMFLREISKDLKNIKSSIDKVLTSIKSVEDDIRRLRGKNFMELLSMRKQKVLKQKQENELDQIHIQVTTQDYDPISGNKKTNSKGEFITFLIKNQYDNFDGEVNEFLWSDQEKQKDVMLIKGKAGSGKSRAARNIEEFIWICDSIKPNWIPIYLSLPSLKDPHHNLIDQALESEIYNFDNIQIREFKDAVINGNLKIVVILESYDEMKIDCIGTNLYHTNRLVQDLNLQASGQTVKMIITTREEILNQIGYQTWFYGQSIETLKEIEILPFSQEQSSQYIKIYAEISVKRTIKRFYEFLKQLKGQVISLDEFKQIWSQIENTINSIIMQKQNSEVLFQTQDVDKLILKIQAVEFFNFIKSNQMVSLKKELLQLWGEQKFSQVINNVNINHLLTTPFMMEIIVYVLPKMSQFFSQSNLIRDLLKKNFMVLKREAKKSEVVIEEYQTRQNKNSEDLNQLNVKKEKKNLESEILEQFNLIMEDLDSQNFFEQFSIANSLEYINNNTIFSSRFFKVRYDANFIVSAFRLNQFTAFDFYEIFVNFYHNQQLQKLKDLGKSIKLESVLLDLQDFSIFLAIDMSQRQITQVNYKSKGKLYIKQAEEERKVEVSWEDSYFSDNQDDFEYKTLLRKCMLINSKGSIYSFNHKSIQEFFVAKYILNLIERLFNNESQSVDQTVLQSSSFNKDQFNLSLDHYSGTLEILKPKLKQIGEIKQKLIQIIQLSKIESKKKFLRSASNSLYIISSLREHFDGIDFSNIQIEDTKLNGISFYQCNLNNTCFNNVSIDSCNFNCAKIQNAVWEKLICKEKPSLSGHNSKITQVVFSDDGTTLLSGSQDGTLNIWQVYADEEPKRADLPNNDKLITISKGKNLLACLSENNVYFYNPHNLTQLRFEALVNDNYGDVILSPNDEWLAAQVKQGQVHLWKIENLEKPIQNQRYISKENDKGQINCIAISSNYQLLATCGKQITLWNCNKISDIQEIAELPAQSKNIFGVAFSKDNEILVTGGENKQLKFWNIKDLTNVQLLYSFDQQEIIMQVSYSYDGKMLAARTQSSIKLYEVDKLLEQQDFFKLLPQCHFKIIEISSDCQILTSAEYQTSYQNNSKAKIYVWDIKNFHQIQMIHTLEEHTQNILCLKITNDNKVLGSSSVDQTICLWDLTKYSLIIKLEAHTKKVSNIAFSFDGRQMVSNGDDKTIIFWDITKIDQPQIQTKIQQSTDTKIIAFCPFKSIMVSLAGPTSKGIQFWNTVEFTQIPFEPILDYFLDVSFRKDGNAMVTLSKNIGIRIWKINEQSFQIEKKIPLINLQYLQRGFYLDDENFIIQNNIDVIQLQIQNEEIKYTSKLLFSRNAYGMSVASNSKFVVIGSIKGLEIVVRENQNSPNQISSESNIQYRGFQFSLDSSLISAVFEKGFVIQNIETKQRVKNFEEKNNCLSVGFVSNERVIVGTDTLGGQLILYDIKDWQQITKLSVIQLPRSPYKITFLEQRQQICVYSYYHIILLNLQKLDLIQLIQINKGKKSGEAIFNSDQSFFGVGLDNRIYFQSLSDILILDKIFTLTQPNYLYKNFSQNSEFFSAISKDSIYYQYELNKNQIAKQTNLNLANLEFATLNPQESQLVAIQNAPNQKWRQKLSMIDLETQKTISCFEEIDEEKFVCLKAIFSEDGLNFVSCYLDLTIKLWDAKSCKLLSMFKSDTASIDFLRISSKGILAQTSKEVIKLWNLIALKQQQFEMDGHTDSVNQLCISSDGFQLVTGSNVEIIRWDLIELRKIDVLLTGKRLPSSFCFSTNCQYFAAQDDKQLIHIWKLNTKFMIENHYQQFCIIQDKVAFSLDQTQLIWKHSNSQIFILNLEQVFRSKQLISQPRFSPESRSITINSNILVKTNPFELILTSNNSELKNEDMVGIQVSQTTTIAICHVNQRLALEDQNQSIIIWSLERKQTESILQHSSLKNNKILSMAFSGNGQILYSCHTNEVIKYWNVTDKFALIKSEELKTVNNVDRKILLLYIFPLKEEEFIAVWYEESQVWVDAQVNQIVVQTKEVVVLDEAINYPLSSSNFIAGYNEAKNLVAVQYKANLKIYDVSQQKAKVIVVLEGNYLEKQPRSSILQFSEDGNHLLALGINHTLRFWDISDQNKIVQKINQSKLVETLAFAFINSSTIRIFSKSGEIIDENISEYTQTGVIEEGTQFDFDKANIQLGVYFFFGKFDQRTLYIMDAQTNEIKYTLNQFSSQIKQLQFASSGEKFILGMEDGSILLYMIDSKTLKNYENPICYYTFAKSPLLQASCCNIQQSRFQTIENENFEKLLLTEKGAIK
ncbi:unnamed protein product (macronuclear) [Paramecium tetraurelia]|uniref:WD domain, G-beta repeat protein n=1 Tax=Paramecium tetraurelia TaxID=5888 RepID=A0C1G8_PARTE|nr:uncharacterized protein GSPATT00034111001 [Paramecium tetraurelia]CAK64635.1 unnamed protein product [Paramecium tetraurelia]|eukprot:XP_001432032.1 hypothetical protein (macronuclear) [Paramecium tetraurelia strain d4-2]